MQAFGSGGHHSSHHSSSRGAPRPAQPEYVQSKLVRQMEASLNQSVRQALLHWDEHALNLEVNYDELLHERNGLHQENRSLQKQVAALQKDVNEKVGLLKEFQEGHMKSTGSRRLAPSTSAISDDYEALERQVKNTVFARLARLNIRHPDIKQLLEHEPFMEAVKEAMVDQKAAKDAENLPLGLSEVVPPDEVKGLLNWMAQAVIHSVLHRRVMEMGMPGLHESELGAVNKVFELIALSEGDQGIKIAEQWRADTYKRLAYWAENIDDLTKYAESSTAVAEVASLFSTIIDSAEHDMYRILEPLCDENTPEGANFRQQLVAIVENALQFSMLIGSQVSRYKLLRTMQPGNNTDFAAVPEHLENSSADTTPLFYAVPALVKTSNEEGETYDVAELLREGKIYVLFDVTPPRNLDDEDEPATSVPDTASASASAPGPSEPEREIKLASPVNGEDMIDQSTDSSLDIINREEAAIEKEQAQPPAEQRAQESEQRPESVEGAEDLEPHDARESNTSTMAFSETVTLNQQELIILPACKGEKATSPATTSTTTSQTSLLMEQPPTSDATVTMTSASNESATAPPQPQQQVETPSSPVTELTETIPKPAETSPPEAASTTTPPLIPLETSETAPAPANENLASQIQCTPAVPTVNANSSKTLEPSSSKNPLPSLASRFQALEPSLTAAPASPSSPALPQAPPLPQLLDPQAVPPVPGDNSRDSSPIQTPATESAPHLAPSVAVLPPPVEATVSVSPTPLAEAPLEAEAEAATPSPQPQSADQDPVAAAAVVVPAASTPSTSQIGIALSSEPETAPPPTSSNNSTSITESTPRSVPELTVSLAGTGVVVEEGPAAQAGKGDEKDTVVTVQEAGGVEVLL
ncbi:hypothetical protein ABW21_db0204632 [Orbilia brochopaga]|nr:hypothetical protein ABW21_db0204632 [Drechslerella brochopaga]